MYRNARKSLETWSCLQISREMQARETGLPLFCIEFFGRTFLLSYWYKVFPVPFARCLWWTSSQKEWLVSERFIKRVPISAYGRGSKKKVWLMMCHSFRCVGSWGKPAKPTFALPCSNPLRQRGFVSTDQSRQIQVFVLLILARPTYSVYMFINVNLKVALKKEWKFTVK